jgi:hypothetical protein
MSRSIFEFWVELENKWKAGAPQARFKDGRGVFEERAEVLRFFQKECVLFESQLRDLPESRVDKYVWFNSAEKAAMLGIMGDLKANAQQSNEGKREAVLLEQNHLLEKRNCELEKMNRELVTAAEADKQRKIECATVWSKVYKRVAADNHPDKTDGRQSDDKVAKRTAVFLAVSEVNEFFEDKGISKANAAREEAEAVAKEAAQKLAREEVERKAKRPKPDLTTEMWVLLEKYAVEDSYRWLIDMGVFSVDDLLLLEEDEIRGRGALFVIMVAAVKASVIH